MFMNSPVGLAAVLLGLAVVVSPAQTRPGGAATTPAADARTRIATKVNELSKRIEAQVEAARLKEKAAATLVMLEDVTGGREAPPSKVEAAVPSLKNDWYILQQYEDELQDMAGRLGSGNSKYKARATRVET